MKEIQTDIYGSYKTFGIYNFYTTGLVLNTDNNRMINLNKAKNRIKTIYIEGYGAIEIGKIMAWLFLLDEDPDVDYDEIDIEYVDGNMANCSVENIKVAPAIGRPSKYLYLVRKGSTDYTEYTRAELSKYLGKSSSWIDSHINTEEPFLWNNALYSITDDIFFTWQYM